MNTDTFIRHYTRKILTEARERKRLGGISRGAREALGLADTDPKKLLTRLGFPSGGEKMTLESVIKKFTENETVALAFENPRALSSGVVTVYIRVLRDESADEGEGLSASDRVAISPYQAPRYVKATVNAAAKAGVLDINPDRVEYRVFKEDDNFLVEIEGR